MSFIFGGNTQLTYDQVQKQREVANALLTANMRTPQNVGEGLSAIGRALAARAIDKRTGREEARLRDEFNAKWGNLFSGAGGGSTSYAGGGGSPSGTWTPAAPGPKATESFLGMPDVVEGGHEFTGMPKADPGVIGAKGGLSFGAATMTPQEMLIAGAEARGLNPIDVATAISYETGGKFDPMISGPTTQWGTHRGLIQFGEPQAQQHGVDFTNSDTAWRSQLNPTSGAIWSYLDGAGVKPGMGLDQIYSAINAGSVGRMGASDANNGGAPGTVADKVAGMGPHRQNAAAFLGGTWTPNPGQGGAPASGGGSVVPMGMDIGALVSLASDPMASPAQKAIIEQLIGQQLAMADPLRQIEMQKAQLELAQLQNPTAKPVNLETFTGADGVVYSFNPMTGETKALTGAEQPEPGYTVLTQEEVQALGLPPGAYQKGPKGEIKTIGGGGTTVNVSTGSEVGTIPQGYELFTDPDTGARSMRPIAGGPEDTSEKDAVADSNAAVASDVVTKATDRALEANKGRVVGGLLGAAAAFNPSTQNAELYRQVDVLKSNAKVENLTAMRAASPTGGALGSVTEKEADMLAQKSGALEPASPNFERDLLDYTRTLLQVIHGKEAGDAIFNEKYGNAASGAAAGGNDLGLSEDDLQYLEQP